MTTDDRRAILITGCSSGIGLDAARTLAARGWRVFAACRKRADVERLAAEGLESLRLDYEKPATIAEAAGAALERSGGRLDALFNNGAYAVPGFLEDMPVEAMRAIFEANFLGWHDLTRRVLPAMRARRRGRIVQCSSVLGFAAVRWRGSYVATKFALEGYTDTLRMELRGSGVAVSLIEPGPIATRFNENAYAEFERWIDPAASAHRHELGEIARRYRGGAGGGYFTLPPSAVTRRLIHAVESRRPCARYRVTTPTNVVAALKRFAPGWALDRLMERN